MSDGANCRSACRTKDHASFGACCRAANLKIAFCGQGGGDATAQKVWDQELADYKTAVSHGIEPEGTTRAKIDQANRLSELHGVPYGTPQFEAKVVGDILATAS